MRYVIKVLPFVLALPVWGQTWAGLSTFGGTNYDIMWSIDFRGTSTISVLGLFTISYSISGSDEDFVLITPSWQRVIGQTGGKDDWIYKTQWLNSGNIVVGGTWCRDTIGSPGSCQAPLYGLLVGLDGSGNPLWGRHADFSDQWGCSGNPNRETRILYVSPTSDGGFLAAGYLGYNALNIFNQCVSLDLDGFIAKFNSSGNLSWIRVVDAGSDEIATTAFETSDGNYVLVAPSFNEIGVLKFNPNGDTLWQRRYPRDIASTSSATIYFSWAKPTSDGGIIVASQIKIGPNDNDVLFVKFNSSGDFVCAARIRTSGHDYGIDVAESNNYYWVTGSLGVGGNDLFIAKIRKTDCNVLQVRRILSGADEQGRSIDINPSSQIPYVAGYTNNSAWSAGNYDGLVAADTGGIDTCYWRTYTPTISYPTLSPSGSYTIYSPSMSVSSISVNVQPVSLGRRIQCGLDPLGDDSELGTDEKFLSCEVNYAVIGNNLRIRVKSEKETKIELYDPSGKMVFGKSAKGEVINVPLRRGVYFLKVGRKIDRVVIN